MFAGDVVTPNVHHPFHSVEGAWRLSEDFEVRGEILLPWKEFDQLNRGRVRTGGTALDQSAQCRCRTLKSLNPAVAAERKLDAYWRIISGEQLPADTHYGCLEAARKLGAKAFQR